MKKYVDNYSYLTLLAGSIVLLDQWSKSIVRKNLTLSQTWMPWEWLASFARVIHWKNAGAAFGLGQSFGGLFTVLAFIVIGLIIYYYPHIPREDWPFRIALGLQLGGAIGNLVDRLAQGYVTDFISVGKFPVFNVADASISVGVAVLVIGMWIQKGETEAARTESRASAGEAEPSLGVEDLHSE